MSDGAIGICRVRRDAIQQLLQIDDEAVRMQYRKSTCRWNKTRVTKTP